MTVEIEKINQLYHLQISNVAAFEKASELYSSSYHYVLNELYHTYWKEIGKASSLNVSLLYELKET